MKPNDHLIVALDTSPGRAIKLVNELSSVKIFKIGWRLLVTSLMQDQLPVLVKLLVEKNKYIFLDLKIADVSSTILESISPYMGIAQFITLHGSTNRQTIEHLSRLKRHAILCIVPVLSDSIQSDKEVLATTDMALLSGCTGIVTSGARISLFRKTYKGISIIAVGIRPNGCSSPDEHTAPLEPEHAIRAGANYIVVGRPIINAVDPILATEQILYEVEVALHDQRKAVDTNPYIGS